MAGFKSNEKLHLFEFIGTEDTNVLVSMMNLRQEINALAHLDALYQATVGNAEIPQDDAIIMQCLLYCHYHLYFSSATLLRRHLSEAFASVRTAIEASLHAYRILEGHGTPEEYINRAATFRFTPNSIRKVREKNPKAFPLADTLLKIYEQCSEFASHADFASFVHRLEVVRGEKTELLVHYFQGPRSVPETQIYMVQLLQTFTEILRIFEPFLIERHKIVSQEWSDKVHAFAATLAGLKRTLAEAKSRQTES